MTRSLVFRQRARRGLLLVALLLFPVTLNYFSPAIILMASSEGVVNASLIVFGLMFAASLFLGRLWCGWACPAGALAELAQPANERRIGRKAGLIKWLIWLPWLAGIAALAISAGGYRQVNPWYNLETGVTLMDAHMFAIYYIVLALFAALAFLVGRRAGCHTICWMAPFMIVGRWISNRLRLPALRLAANPQDCAGCKKCTTNCPMSLDVNAMVQLNHLENRECILCGTCVDNCSKSVLRYTFSRPK